METPGLRLDPLVHSLGLQGGDGVAGLFEAGGLWGFSRLEQRVEG